MKRNNLLTDNKNYYFREGDYPSRGVFGISHNIMIPVEVDHDNNATCMFVVNYEGFPEGGQRNLIDITGIRIREGLAGLTIYRGTLEHSLQQGYVESLLKISRSIDQCDVHTRFHSIRTGLWARHLAKKMGLEQEADNLSLAGKLHDIGKVFIPRTILTKPSQLSLSEWELVKKHPSLGVVLMKPSALLAQIIPYVNAHHEHYDGSGYPNGLSGDAIPLPAKILAVADAFATITEGRIYKKPANVFDALSEIERCSGRQFDPLIVKAMRDLVLSGCVRDWMGIW